MLQALGDELLTHQTHLQDVLRVGRDLVEAGNSGSRQIGERIAEMEAQWKALTDLEKYRKGRLQDSLNFYQVNLQIVAIMNFYSAIMIIHLASVDCHFRAKFLVSNHVRGNFELKIYRIFSAALTRSVTEVYA